ncbi:acyltransferase [Bowmanella dokdonensis]|uniref:Acyltransferase n=1 Tax=Bowmanella dokdonensis TaxID=751969 RepID=A0A939DRA0_9ALTE|nr:acyltransferase [Bowmanella dokdonensis]MBN7827523.1 acyltransferase [Bowmanella dokdonensis]
MQEPKISAKASFYNIEHILIGHNSRIDDFCVLSAGLGGIDIGRNVHIAVYTSLMGAGKITIEDFANLSSRVAVYSSNDDYSGHFMTNPTVPAKYTDVTHAPVHIGRHVIVGCGAVILPGVTIGEGAAIGALSLVKDDVEPFAIYAGVPAKKVGMRHKGLLDIERKWLG